MTFGRSLLCFIIGVVLVCAAFGPRLSLSTSFEIALNADTISASLTQLPEQRPRVSVIGFCSICGYRLKDWRVIVGRKRSAKKYYARIPKVFS
jgi:hypothetical protein